MTRLVNQAGLVALLVVIAVVVAVAEWLGVAVEEYPDDEE